MSDMFAQAKLRERIITILCSSVCQNIRFKVDNVHLQWGMFGYIGGAIRNDFLDVVIDDDRTSEGAFVGYLEGFGLSRTFVFPSKFVPADTIVHEGAHAVIFSTNPGLKVTRGTHETAGWLAGTLYRLRTGYPNLQPNPRADAVLEQVATKIIAFDTKNEGHGVFTVSPADSSAIKAVLVDTSLNYRGGFDRVETMQQLPSTRGGLIFIMRKQQMDIKEKRKEEPHPGPGHLWWDGASPAGM